MTAWPWPLGGVQGFFEGLANTIIQLAAPLIQGVIDTLKPLVEGVSTAVWNALPDWMKNAILWLGELAGQAWTALWAFIRDPVGSIQAGLTWVTTEIGKGIEAVSIGLGGVAAGVWAALPDWVKTPILWLKDIAGAAWETLWNFVKDPIGSIQAGLNWVATSITTAFDGALSTFGSWITDAMAAVAGALGSAIQGVVNWFTTEIPKALSVVAGFIQANIIDPILAAMRWVIDRLTDVVRSFMSTIEGLFSHHSPITPDEALPIGIMATVASVGAGAIGTALVDIASTKVLGTGLTLQALGNYITAAINPPMFMGAVVGALVDVGLQTPITQYYRRLFRTSIPAVEEAQRMLWRGSLNMDQFMDVVARTGYGSPYETGYAALTTQIPGSGDLIRFVIREVIDVSVFKLNMAYQGYSLFWANAYWEAHWILPAPGNLVDAMHREIISRAELNTFYVLHDYKPEPRPGIHISDQLIMSGLTKTLIPRVDLRRGYAAGRLSRSELDRRYKWLGYEEDAELMTDIQVALAFTAEINKLRDNAKDDFVNGFVDEPTLRADLEALGLSADLVSYHVADALADRSRRLKKAQLDYYKDAFMKDLITLEDFDDRVHEILVDFVAAALYIDGAYTQKYKKPAPPRDVEAEEAAEELYKYRVTYIRQLYRTYTIEKPEMITMWVEAGMDADVARTRANYEELTRPIKKPDPAVIERAKEQLRIQQLQEKTLIEEFRKGVRTAEQLLTGLMEIDYSEALATAITQLEIIKALPKPGGAIAG